MAREWIDPASGTQFQEDGEEEYIHPAAGVQFQEDQAVAAGGRIMSSLAAAGGLAGRGGIAGPGGGLAG